MSRLESIALFIAFAVLFGVVGTMDADEAERQHDQYCDMVLLWKQTNGEQGWPAFNGECK